MARFERSTLPEHKGTRTVVLRLVKKITSVKCVVPHYDGWVAQPKEGELHWRPSIHTGVKAVWGINIDKTGAPMKRSLQLLWDA